MELIKVEAHVVVHELLQPRYDELGCGLSFGHIFQLEVVPQPDGKTREQRHDDPSGYQGLEQFVHDNMGFHFDQYIPLIGAIFALSIGCNLISVVGLWSPTADLNTEAAWAIVVFVLIMYYKIKTNGILAYIKGLLDPIFIMAPINVLSEISTPVSMAFRHFGNILSGTVISTLLYWALASLSHVIFGWLPGFLSQIQLFQKRLLSLFFRIGRLMPDTS